MIRSLHLEHFKAFESFTITFPEDAVLVGPNNAGKSTVIAALRSVASMVRTASRFRPPAVREMDSVERFGHNFSGQSIGLIEENLRYEFHEVETRLAVRFKGDASIEAAWPVDDSGGFFWVMDNDINPRVPKHVRSALPTIGLVPVLSPVDHVETLLSESYVRANLDGRLASRHFRNQLNLLKGEYTAAGVDRFSDFKAFAAPWIGELELTDLQLRYGQDGAAFDLFYLEPGSRTEKEIFWSGDGMQIWLQLLLHLYRLQSSGVIVLDEPDVFLHSDLQRRLVRLLEELPAQTITATHSAEVVGEAAAKSIVWVSRERARAIRAPKGELLVDLSASLGTQFNLRLARALKTRVVLFVEGEDIKVLSAIAKTLGLASIHRESGIAVIPLGGFDGWEHVEPFKWLMDEFFEEAASVHVILDRDYRLEDAIERVRRRLRSAGINPHVWRRKELENYLLVPEAVARLTETSQGWVEETLAAAALELEDDVYSQIHAEYMRQLRRQTPRPSEATISKAAKKRADALWAEPQKRLHVCGGKELLRLLNGRLQESGHNALTFRRLARSLRKGEIDEEMRSVLEAIDAEA
jgi:energy-coupling factor transporter ATP-binding protein EcfA2